MDHAPRTCSCTQTRGARGNPSPVRMQYCSLPVPTFAPEPCVDPSQRVPIKSTSNCGSKVAPPPLLKGGGPAAVGGLLVVLPLCFVRDQLDAVVAFWPGCNDVTANITSRSSIPLRDVYLLLQRAGACKTIEDADGELWHVFEVHFDLQIPDVHIVPCAPVDRWLPQHSRPDAHIVPCAAVGRWLSQLFWLDDGRTVICTVVGRWLSQRLRHATCGHHLEDYLIMPDSLLLDGRKRREVLVDAEPLRAGWRRNKRLCDKWPCSQRWLNKRLSDKQWFVKRLRENRWLELQSHRVACHGIVLLKNGHSGLDPGLETLILLMTRVWQQKMWITHATSDHIIDGILKVDQHVDRCLNSVCDIHRAQR